jgi:opacity protein-like surface antigen
MSFSWKLAVAAVCALAACQAGAQQRSPYYLGVDVGVHTQYRDLRCGGGVHCDDSADFSGRLYGGYQFGSSELFGLKQHNALELGVFGFGHARSLIQAGAPDFYLGGKSKVYGSSLNYVAGLDLAEGLRLNAKVGLSVARSSVQYATMTGLNDFGANGSVRHNRVGVDYGLGASYALDRNWSLHADWLRTPVKLGAADKTSVNLYSLGLGYDF